jgi:MFS family permease
MPPEAASARNRVALLAALGVDNFGSGLFLPLGLVYVTRVVGLPLGTAGTLVSLGTLAGLAVPAFAGRLVDRIGPKPVIIAAQLLQALGATCYLLAPPQRRFWSRRSCWPPGSRRFTARCSR